MVKTKKEQPRIKIDDKEYNIRTGKQILKLKII